MQKCPSESGHSAGRLKWSAMCQSGSCFNVCTASDPRAIKLGIARQLQHVEWKNPPTGMVSPSTLKRSTAKLQGQRRFIPLERLRHLNALDSRLLNSWESGIT
jgi:hypothetical protein